MGCSSCGQRYRPNRTTAPLNSRILARQQLSLRRRRLMAKDSGTSPSSGTIQPQPLQGVLAPVMAPNLDPATGHDISVIKTGTCSEQSLGETTLAPLASEESYAHEAAESTMQEAAEHAAGGAEANG